MDTSEMELKRRKIVKTNIKLFTDSHSEMVASASRGNGIEYKVRENWLEFHNLKTPNRIWK